MVKLHFIVCRRQVHYHFIAMIRLNMRMCTQTHQLSRRHVDNPPSHACNAPSTCAQAINKSNKRNTFLKRRQHFLLWGQPLGRGDTAFGSRGQPSGRHEKMLGGTTLSPRTDSSKETVFRFHTLAALVPRPDDRLSVLIV